MGRLIDADALMEASKYEFWQDGSAITPIGEYILGKFRRLIRNMPTVTPEPQWIPVSERLPESRVYVLVTYEYQYGLLDHGISWFEDKRKEWMSTREVTAWMPLPEPYREEGE